MNPLLLLSDIHGKTWQVDYLLSEFPDAKIIQLGDFGFNDDYAECLTMVNASRLKVLAGNHDDYTSLCEYPHNLGDFGLVPDEFLEGTAVEGKKIAFIRGAQSIDRHLRKAGISWWPNEQLTDDIISMFRSWWINTKPDILLSHCSTAQGLFEIIPNPIEISITEKVLTSAFADHTPKKHFHGHLHFAHQYEVNGCICRSLGIGEVIELR